jgi:hypothetical protein
LQVLLQREGVGGLLQIVQVAPELGPQLAGAREAGVAVGAEGAQGHVAQGLRRVREQGRQVAHVAATHPREHVLAALAAEEPVPHQQLAQHHTEGPHVGAAVDALAAGLLRRHVRVLALDRAVVGLARRAGPGDAKIANLHRAVVREQHVGGRHVAVHNLHGPAALVEALVGVVEPAGHLAHDVGHEGRGDGLALTLRDAREEPEVGAVDVLHHQQERGAVGLEAVHLHHVGVVEPQGHPGLVDEHRAEGRVVGKLRQDALDHHVFVGALGAARAREKHLGHAAGPEPLHHRVATEPHGDRGGRRHGSHGRRYAMRRRRGKSHATRRMSVDRRAVIPSGVSAAGDAAGRRGTTEATRWRRRRRHTRCAR